MIPLIPNFVLLILIIHVMVSSLPNARAQARHGPLLAPTSTSITESPVGYLLLLDTYILHSDLADLHSVIVVDNGTAEAFSFQLSATPYVDDSVKHDFLLVTPTTLADQRILNILIGNPLTAFLCLSIPVSGLQVCIRKIIEERAMVQKRNSASQSALDTPLGDDEVRSGRSNVSSGRMLLNNNGVVDGMGTVDVVERMGIANSVWPGRGASEHHSTVTKTLNLFAEKLSGTLNDNKNAEVAPLYDGLLYELSVFGKAQLVLREWLTSTKGEGTSVGLFDSGVSLHHEGFKHVPNEDPNTEDSELEAGRVTYCKSFIGATAARGASQRDVANVAGTDGCHDGFGHGTFVAGVVGSGGVAVQPPKGFNQRGVGVKRRGDRVVQADEQLVEENNQRPAPRKCRGIAPSSRLHVFKTFTDQQVSYTSYFLAALNAALQAGSIDVINLSMGGYDYEDHPFVEKALELSAAGMTLVTAGGNDGPHWGTQYNPADQIDVVAVGAVNKNNRIARFSSRGMTTWELPFGVGRPKPDVLAYGDPIAGSSMKAGSCRSLSGTSMASPVVAGVLSLVVSTFKKKQLLCSLCVDKGSAGIQLCAQMSLTTDYCRAIARSGPSNVALLKQVLFATSSPIFPLRNPSNTLGQSGLSSYTVLEHSIFAQGAGLVDAAKAVTYAATSKAIPRLTAFPPNLFMFAHPSSFIASGGSEHSISAEEAANECQYMWPWCAQPIYFTGMPLRINVTLLNSASLVAKRVDCYALLRQHGALHKHIGVTVDCSDRLWPHVGTVAISFSVLKPFVDGAGPWGGQWLAPENRHRDFSPTAVGDGTSSDALGGIPPGRDDTPLVVTMETATFVIVEGTIEVRYNGGTSTPNLHASIPFRVKVLKQTPPRSKRLLWDVSHSIQFPFSYIPRDSLDKSTAGDFLDWNGDHPHTNYATMFVHLTSSQGYYVDILASPKGLMEDFTADGAPHPSRYPNHVKRPLLRDLHRKDSRSPSIVVRSPNEWQALFGHQPLSASYVLPSNNGRVASDYLPHPLEGCDMSSIASRYGAILLADTEDFYTPKEIGSLHQTLAGGGWLEANKGCHYITDTEGLPTATPTFGLLLVSEWHNGPLLGRLGGVDDNTGAYWEPLVGGSNVPALNELLAPYQIQLSHIVVDGEMETDMLAPSYNSSLPDHPTIGALDGERSNDIRPIFRTGGTVQLVPSVPQCQWCSSLKPGRYSVDSRTVPAHTEQITGGADSKYGEGQHATLLFTKPSSAGRIAILTDSSCLDMAHHPHYPHDRTLSEGDEASAFAAGMAKYLSTFCFSTLDAMLAFTMRVAEVGGEGQEAQLDLRQPAHMIRHGEGQVAVLREGSQCYPCGPAAKSASAATPHLIDRFDLLDNSTFYIHDHATASDSDRHDVVQCPLSLTAESSFEERCRSIIPYQKDGGGPLYFSASELASHLKDSLDRMHLASWAARRRLGVAESDGDDDWDRHRMHRRPARKDSLINDVSQEDLNRDLLQSEGNLGGRKRLRLVPDEHYEMGGDQALPDTIVPATMTAEVQEAKSNNSSSVPPGHHIRDEARNMRREMDPHLKRQDAGNASAPKLASNANYSRYLVISTSNPLLPLLFILWVAKWVLTYKLFFNKHTRTRIYGILTRLRLLPVFEWLRLMWALKMLSLVPPFGEAHAPGQEV